MGTGFCCFYTRPHRALFLIFKFFPFFFFLNYVHVYLLQRKHSCSVRSLSLLKEYFTSDPSGHPMWEVIPIPPSNFLTPARHPTIQPSSAAIDLERAPDPKTKGSVPQACPPRCRHQLQVQPVTSASDQPALNWRCSH